MAQRSEQIQQQQMEQRQTLSQRQVLFVRLLELPTEELEERVRSEVLENPALEVDTEGRDEGLKEDDSMMDEENPYSEDEQTYAPEADAESLSVLGDYRTEDDIPDYALRTDNGVRGESAGDIPFSVGVSFYEALQAQLGECTFTPHEREVAEYLIGSLDDDGLLRKSAATIADEMAIYHGVGTRREEVERVLHAIQKFDPPGIGAQSLQECLQLQLSRKPDSAVKQTAMQILKKCYEDFTYKRWERIRQKLSLTEEDFRLAIEELTHLNPRPGTALGETIDKGMQRIIPDFIVRVEEDDRITFSLNDGNLPELQVSNSFQQLMKEYAADKHANRERREALLFLRQKMDSAQNFIEAVEQRRLTLTITMQAIIELQRDFFLEGSEQLLKPMLLKDVADRAGVDVSTVSRVSNCKYVETDFGIYPLKFFFGDSYRRPAMVRGRDQGGEKEAPVQTVGGEDISLRQVRAIIQECVEAEDKNNPLNDAQLASILKDKGYEIARRTVAKYREQLGIPVARMRR